MTETRSPAQVSALRLAPGSRNDTAAESGWNPNLGRDLPSTSQSRPPNDRGRWIREQTVQNVRFLQTDRLRLAVPPPGQAGDRGADHDPAEKPGHVFADVRVPGDLNTISKRFGGDIVPGGEIRKRKDRRNLSIITTPPSISFVFKRRRWIRPEGYNPLFPMLGWNRSDSVTAFGSSPTGSSRSRPAFGERNSDRRSVCTCWISMSRCH